MNVWLFLLGVFSLGYIAGWFAHKFVLWAEMRKRRK